MTDVASLSVSATETGVAKVDKALLGLAGSAMKAETATGRFTRSAAGIDAMFKSSTGARDRAKDVEHYAQEMDNLRAKYNPLFAASKRYETELGNISRAEKLGAITANEAATARTRLATSLAPDRIDAAGNSMKNFGGHTANVFAQLNDIGMMMAAGQNPLQLALQQGTSLNQTWGAIGGNIGAVGTVLRGAFMQLLNPLNLVTIGVIAGGAALVNYFTGGSEAAKTLSQKLDDLDASLSRMNENVKIYSADGIQKLVEKYGEVNAQILQMINNQTQFDINNAMKLARGSVAGLVDELGHIPDSTDKGFRFAGIAVSNMAMQLDISKDQVIALGDAMRAIQSASTFEEQNAALSIMNNILAQSSMKTDELAGNALRAQDIIAQLSNSAPKANWMNASIDGVNALIGRIGAAITAANKLNSFAGTVKGAATGGAGVGAAGSGSFTLESTGKLGGYGSSGGGGGGGSDPYQANLDRLMSSLMTERETVEKWYADNEVILNDRRAMELLGAAGHKEAMLDLERQYHEKLKGIRETSDQFSLDSAASLFGNLNSMAGGGYDGLLRAQRSFAAASALISTYKGAADELARPTATPWQKFASVAKVIATGMGFVSAIKGGGSGGGGGSSKAPTSVGGAAAEPTRTTTVSFQGDPFMVAIAESVMSQMYEASGNGRVLIKA
jgi:hypothetical protein